MPPSGTTTLSVAPQTRIDMCIKSCRRVTPTSLAGEARLIRQHAGDTQARSKHYITHPFYENDRIVFRPMN